MSEPFSIRMPPDVQSLQIGEHQVVLIDNFLEDPQALIEAACQATYAPAPGFAERKGYPGIRAPAPAAYGVQLTDLMDPLIKINFDVPEALGIRKSVGTFSLTTVPPSELGPL
ncbi:MAG: DUF6445 family protein, partial [Burkholderiaceae bacterium]